MKVYNEDLEMKITQMDKEIGNNMDGMKNEIGKAEIQINKEK